ncbi:hypothetical protein EBU95_15040 [bacterium]|nr:hypothetical protein [bacterium]
MNNNQYTEWRQGEKDFYYYSRNWVTDFGNMCTVTAKVRSGNPFPFYWIFLNTGTELVTVSYGKIDSFEKGIEMSKKLVDSFLPKK